MSIYSPNINILTPTEFTNIDMIWYQKDLCQISQPTSFKWYQKVVLQKCELYISDESRFVALPFSMNYLGGLWTTNLQFNEHSWPLVKTNYLISLMSSINIYNRFRNQNQMEELQMT